MNKHATVPTRLSLAAGGAICAAQVVEVLDVKLRLVRTQTGAAMTLTAEGLRVLQRLRDGAGK